MSTISDSDLGLLNAPKKQSEKNQFQNASDAWSPATNDGEGSGEGTGVSSGIGSSDGIADGNGESAALGKGDDVGSVEGGPPEGVVVGSRATSVVAVASALGSGEAASPMYAQPVSS